MQKNWKIWLGLVVVTLTVIGLAVIPAALADESGEQDAAPTPTPPNIDTVCANFAGKVATNLGVSVDTLKNAITDAALQMVDDALTNGTITEAQAERMRERIQEGMAGGCLRWFGWRCGEPMGGPPDWGLALGPKGCIESAVENGVITQDQADQIKALAQQIREQIRERVQNGFLGEAVEKGILTQEQADQINSLREQIKEQVRERNQNKGGTTAGRG